MRIVIALAVFITLLLVSCQEETAPLPRPEQPSPPPEEETAPEQPKIYANIVEITSLEFSPKTITIKAGEAVIFVNKDTKKHWPASNLHPTHQTYPGSSIEKCGTAAEENIFDSCRGLQPEESYSFTFDHQGRWPYHDHLDVRLSGVVVVE